MASKPGYTGFTKVIADELDAVVLKQNGTAIGSGTGDVAGPASSVDNELALFSGTGGKTIKRASTTGVLKAANGVIAAAVAGTDFIAPGGAAAVASVTIASGFQVTRLIKGSVNIDLVAPAGQAQTIDITVTGAQVGDSVILNPRVSLTAGNAPARGMFFTARVSATNTVTITYDSQGTSDRASEQWDFLVIG